MLASINGLRKRIMAGRVARPRDGRSQTNDNVPPTIDVPYPRTLIDRTG
jgi:hypothetical protein